MNNTLPLVSIMIPVYNREAIISETIKCAINQTYKNIEIIISDNCSTDGTWAVLQEYAKKDNRIKLFKNEANIGPVLNWKVCIDKIQGEFTKILWSDDLISLDFIEKTIKVFDDETAFVMSGIKFFNSDIKNIFAETKFQKKLVYTKNDYLKDILVYGKKDFPVSPGCALFRTTDIKSSYTEEIPNCENLVFKKYGAGNDLLFFLITANKHEYVKTTDKAISFFRSHSDSFSVSNNLVIFYEYAKWYFIKNNFYTLKKVYKSKLTIEAKILPELSVLNNSIPDKFSYINQFLFRISRLIS